MQGLQNGYVAVADHIRIGELEFQDCLVGVGDLGSVTDDGLIGADVFGDYLVDIDLPGERLKLSPLPKRPEDAVAPTSLNSEGEEQGNAERKEEGATEQSPRGAETLGAWFRDLARPATGSLHCSGDGELDESLSFWPRHPGADQRERFKTHVVRTRHGRIQQCSLAARGAAGRQGELQLPRSGQRPERRGESGLQFREGDIEFWTLSADEPGMVTFDLSGVSSQTGTEISGFLGFEMLRKLELKLDYRDGLVDFVCDRNRVPLNR